MHPEEDAERPANHQYGGPHLRAEEHRLVGVQGEGGAFQRLHDPQAHVGEDEEHEDVAQLQARLVGRGHGGLGHYGGGLGRVALPGRFPFAVRVQVGGYVPDPAHDPRADLHLLLPPAADFPFEQNVVRSSGGDRRRDRVLGAVKVYIFYFVGSTFFYGGSFSLRRPSPR